jgi:hypothetical protein
VRKDRFVWPPSEVFNLRRDAILLYVLFLLVVSVSDQAVAPKAIVTQDSLDFVLSQTEMLIYKMVTPEVNATYAQSLLSSLFGIHDVLPIEDEGRYIANFGNRSFEVDSSDGSLWYADYSKLWNISLDVGETTANECHIAADEWLAEKGLYPANAVFVNVGNTSATIYDVDTAETTSKVLQYHVNYEFRINDLPITGETAQISVIMGDGCEIIGLDWKWRDVEADVYATSTLIEYESILDTEGIVASEVEDYELVYDTDEETGLLFPVYKLNVLKIDTDGIDIHMLLKLDATEFKPRVFITNPSSSITVTPGTSVTFDCTVSLGTPPYTYEWKSDFDGVLSTASTFSTSTLTEVLKKGVNVPHAIAVSVWDAEDRWLSDVVAVTIDSSPPIPLDLGVVFTLGAVFVLASALIIMKKKGAFVLLFLLMLVSAFTLFPIVSANSGMADTHRLTPSAPSGAYDDGFAEVGVEWIGLSHNKPLYNNQKNTEGFYNHMGTIGGFSREFNWHEYSAWEEDFKDSSFGGTDTEWVDCVDMVYVHSHAGPNGVAFTSSHDYKALRFSEARLGDGDLETLAIDACKTLAWKDKYGNNVFERWGPVMQGIHQVCAFATNSANSAKTGPYFGLYMTGQQVLDSTTIVNAWFRSCLETEDSETVSAVFYATKSSNPYQPLQDDPINDHAFGFGYTCSDPTPSVYKNFVYITSNC